MALTCQKCGQPAGPGEFTHREDCAECRRLQQRIADERHNASEPDTSVISPGNVVLDEGIHNTNSEADGLRRRLAEGAAAWRQYNNSAWAPDCAEFHEAFVILERVFRGVEHTKCHSDCMPSQLGAARERNRMALAMLKAIAAGSASFGKTLTRADMMEAARQAVDFLDRGYPDCVCVWLVNDEMGEAQPQCAESGGVLWDEDERRRMGPAPYCPHCSKKVEVRP